MDKLIPKPKSGTSYTYDECLEHLDKCICDGCCVYRLSNYKFCEAKGIELTDSLRLQKRFTESFTGHHSYL